VTAKLQLGAESADNLTKLVLKLNDLPAEPLDHRIGAQPLGLAGAAQPHYIVQKSKGRHIYKQREALKN